MPSHPYPDPERSRCWTDFHASGPQPHDGSGRRQQCIGAGLVLLRDALQTGIDLCRAFTQDLREMDLELAFHGLKQPTLAVVAGEAAEEPALGLLDKRSLALSLPEEAEGDVLELADPIVLTKDRDRSVTRSGRQGIERRRRSPCARWSPGQWCTPAPGR
ncbi:MAG: hypothetical protein ACREA0_29570 [bacterium]